MGIIDSRIEFSAGSTHSASEDLPQVVDTGPDPRDVGPGRTLYVVAEVNNIDDANGDETYVLELIDSASDDLAAPNVLASVTIPRTVPVGYAAVMAVPWDNRRYLGARTVVGGTSPTIGFSTVYITDDVPKKHKSYPTRVEPISQGA